MGKTKIVLKVGNISAKNNILTVQKKQRASIGNKTKRNLEMSPQKIEIEAQKLKASGMQTKKNRKRKNYYQI